MHAAREADIISPPPPKGKAKQKKGAAFASEQNVALKEESKGKLWEVELLDTIIFPEGTLKPCNANNKVQTQLGSCRRRSTFRHWCHAPFRS